MHGKTFPLLHRIWKASSPSATYRATSLIHLRWSTWCSHKHHRGSGTLGSWESPAYHPGRTQRQRVSAPARIASVSQSCCSGTASSHKSARSRRPAYCRHYRWVARPTVLAFGGITCRAPDSSSSGAQWVGARRCPIIERSSRVLFCAALGLRWEINCRN